MLSQFILLFLINSLSAIGYSLIAPLFPFEAYAKGVNEFMIGLIFSSFAISNVISFPLTPMLIKRIGRRNLFYIAMTIEATCTISFGLVSRIEDKNLFIIISIATRFLQGIGSALSSTLVYSIAASLCEEENIKTTMGYMELAYSVGLTIGPVLAAVLYYFFSYSFPFYICGILTLNCIPFIGDLDIPDDENDLDHPPMFSLLLNWGILFTFLAIIVDMVSGTFIYPVFTTHLNATYGIGVELSSLFFVIMMVSYFITLQFLNDLSEKLGTKLTITLGLTINCFAVLLLAPVKFMPQSVWTIVVGLVILGMTGACVTIPGIVDFMYTMKNQLKVDETIANDFSSAFFNLAINLGECLGPILGGWATENSGFESACWITSSGSLIFTLSFIVMNLKNVKKQITPLPDIQQPLIQSYEEEYENIKPKEDFKTDLSFIKTPRTYVTRYRAFSSSSRNSRRSSYAT